MKASSAGMYVAAVTVNSHIVSEISLASAAEGFDREHITLFHALSGVSFDERNLFVTMDLVAQNIMTSNISNRFDRNNLLVELDLITLHYLLNCLTDVIDAGINASFLFFY